MPEIVSYIEQADTFGNEKQTNDLATPTETRSVEQIICQDQNVVPTLNNDPLSLKADALHHGVEVAKTYTYINKNGEKFSGTLTKTVEQCPVFKEMSAEHAQFVLDNPHIAERLAQRARQKRDVQLQEDNIPATAINAETAKADIKRVKQPQLVTELMLEEITATLPNPIRREEIKIEPDIETGQLARIEIASNEELARQYLAPNEVITDKNNIDYRATSDSETDHLIRQPEIQASVPYGAIHGDTILATDTSETVVAAPSSRQPITLNHLVANSFELALKPPNDLEELNMLTAELLESRITKPEAAPVTVPEAFLRVLENSRMDNTTIQAEAMGPIEIEVVESDINKHIIELPPDVADSELARPELIDLPLSEVSLDTIFDLKEVITEAFNDEDEPQTQSELYMDIDTSSSDDLYFANTQMAETDIINNSLADTTKELTYIPEWSAVVGPDEIEQLELVLGRINEVLDTGLSSLLEALPIAKICEQIIALNISPEDDGLIYVDTKTRYERQSELFTALLIDLAVPATPQLIRSLVSLSQRQNLEKLIPSARLDLNYVDDQPREIGTREFLQKMNHGLSIMKKVAAHFYEIGKSTLLLYRLETDTSLA